MFSKILHERTVFTVPSKNLGNKNQNENKDSLAVKIETLNLGRKKLLKPNNPVSSKKKNSIIIESPF